MVGTDADDFDMVSYYHHHARWWVEVNETAGSGNCRARDYRLNGPGRLESRLLLAITSW